MKSFEGSSLMTSGKEGEILDKKDKKEIFRLLILLAPWIAGAYVGPAGLIIAAVWDLFYILEAE